MNTFKMILAAGALLLGAATANAAYVPATWTQTYTGSQYINSSNSFTYSHDLTDEGFNVGQDLVSNFWLTLNLRDDAGGDWQPELGYVNLPGLTGDAFVTQFGLSGAEYGGWSIVGLLELNLLGTLTVTVSSITGDFLLTSSQLVANGYAQVPEPGTLALLGMGLLGMGLGARRRMTARQ